MPEERDDVFQLAAPDIVPVGERLDGLQVAVRAKDRVRIVKMASEKRS